MKRPGMLGTRGSAAVLFVLALPVFLLLLGLTVEMGRGMVLRQQLQSAADLGALAAVQNVDLERLADGEVVIQPAAARRDARRFARSNLADLAGVPDPPVVAVTVYNVNPEDGETRRNRWTGRLIDRPTVALRIGAAYRPLLLRRLFPELPVAATADASVREKGYGR